MTHKEALLIFSSCSLVIVRRNQFLLYLLFLMNKHGTISVKNTENGMNLILIPMLIRT